MKELCITYEGVMSRKTLGMTNISELTSRSTLWHPAARSCLNLKFGDTDS